jgi:hypothetical protein
MLKRRVLQFLFFLSLANFAIFFFAAIYIGGDAVSGKTVNGHYFLSSHGHLTEVSRAVFTYSLWHTRSVFVTHPIGFLSAWLLSRDQKNEKRFV